ncbi:MAG: cobalt-precorrin-8 methylmutase [Leptospiraceae bacterium]|nr:MAG: cobalt-precorrin-8 methylmutase [Leptospiraceae bacterium]
MKNQDMRQITEKGKQIENDSFAIIDQEVGEHHFPPEEWRVVQRVIHSTADFEFKDIMKFSPNAIKKGIEALKNGAPIITDVKMIIAGLNEQRLATYGCKTYCFISDDDVIQIAKKNNSTRAIESMKKAHQLGLLDGSIVAIGNAPTALIEIARLVKEENARPSLIIGVPVGFVSAKESKEMIMDLNEVEWIVSEGRKGGSTIAVAIIHALLTLTV